MQYETFDPGDRRDQFAKSRLANLEEQHYTTSLEIEFNEKAGRTDQVNSLKTQLKDIENQINAAKGMIESGEAG